MLRLQLSSGRVGIGGPSRGGGSVTHCTAHRPTNSDLHIHIFDNIDTLKFDKFHWAFECPLMRVVVGFIVPRIIPPTMICILTYSTINYTSQ